MRRFAAYIPVGPSNPDIDRLHDLLDGIIKHEDEPPHLIISEHGPKSRNLAEVLKFRGLTCYTVLSCAGQTHLGDWLGMGCAHNLAAMKAASLLRDIKFLLKLDTDAAVIAPFSERLIDLFRRDKTIGIAGVLGTSSTLIKR